jgi:histidinol dehydrogenase
MDKVRKDGDMALREFSRKFDSAETDLFEVSEEVIAHFGK